MISSLTWVPPGAMASRPKKYKLTADDMLLMQRMADEEEGIGERGTALRRALKGKPLDADDDDDDDSIDGDNSDNGGGLSDDDEEGGSGAMAPSALMAMAGLVDTSNALSGHAAGGMAQAGGGVTVEEDDDDDNSSDEDDYHLRPSDAVLLATKSQEDYSSLEVHVYNYDEGNFYVHHDITMPTFPLCVEWLDFATAETVDGTAHTTPGSFAAIGTFGPGIGIYDLDVLEALEPDATLGGPRGGGFGAAPASSGRGHSRGAPVETLKEGSHTAAVMALSWNKGFRNLLASGSADGTAKLWDLATQQCKLTFQHHRGKVQSVEWNPAEQNILATGSFDRSIAIVDARAPKRGSKFALPADIEDLRWNPHAPFQFVAGCEDGTLLSHDLRQGRQALFSIPAHGSGIDGSAVSGLAFSQYVPGLLATCSTDKTVKIWDLTRQGGASGTAASGGSSAQHAPNIVVSKHMNAGPLFSVRFFPGKPFLLGTAGQEGLVAIWDAEEDNHVARCFGGASRQLEAPPVYAKKVSGGASAPSDAAAAAGGAGGGGGAGGASVLAGAAALPQADGSTARPRQSKKKKSKKKKK